MPSSTPVDLTYSLDPTTPVVPNYPRVEIGILESTRYCLLDGRRSLNSTKLSLGVHCGTHMDAPFHFFEDGNTIDRVPLDACAGPALLVDLTPISACEPIDTRQLQVHEARLRDLRKLVLRTDWSHQWGRPEYFADHPVVTQHAAQFLVDCGVQLVGVDFPSLDHPPFPAHTTLLRQGIVIVENLTNLSAIHKEVFNLVVLPLKITGRDGSPVRAIALEA